MQHKISKIYTIRYPERHRLPTHRGTGVTTHSHTEKETKIYPIPIRSILKLGHRQNKKYPKNDNINTKKGKNNNLGEGHIKQKENLKIKCKKTKGKEKKIRSKNMEKKER